MEQPTIFFIPIFFNNTLSGTAKSLISIYSSTVPLLLTRFIPYLLLSITLLEQLEQLLTTASQAEIKSFLIDFINSEDKSPLLATQGLDTTAHLHYLNSLKPVEQCSCERNCSEIPTRTLFE